MTLHRVVESEGFTWLDVVSPSRLDLQDLARTYDLHQTVVEDCLDPEHLPKHEKIGDATFLILRAHDDSAKDDASSIQELTRKVAIFFRPNFALTVHRVDLHEVAMLRERFGGRGGPRPSRAPSRCSSSALATTSWAPTRSRWNWPSNWSTRSRRDSLMAARRHRWSRRTTSSAASR